jgi:Zn-dependent protease
MDQFGIILLLILSVTGTGFAYGFTPVNEARLRQRTEFGPAIVALAGPAMNLILAALVAIPLTHGATFDYSNNASGAFVLFGNAQLYNFMAMLFMYNVFLAVFNLIPLPPLDGWSIFSAFLSPKTRFELRTFVQYGPYILLLLFLFEPQIHVIGHVIFPIRDWVANLLLKL